MGSSEENSISNTPIAHIENEPTLLQPNAGLGFQVSASIDSDLNAETPPPPPVRSTCRDLDELPTVAATHNPQCDGHLSSEDGGVLNVEAADEELQYERAIIEGIQNFVLEAREREIKGDADRQEHTEVVEEEDYSEYADHAKRRMEDAQGDNGFEEGNIDQHLIEEEDGSAADEGDGAESSVSKHVKHKRPTYPVRRSNVEDCAYYMRTGTCKFGSFCKFNHPPSRKNQYYPMSGGRKYGNSCKFKHDGGNTPFPPHNHRGGEVPFSPNVQFHFLGLPVNQGERNCSYYMRTGTCKYAASCRFNHPDLSGWKGNLHSGYNSKGSVSHGSTPRPTFSSWSSPNETGPLPAMFPTRQLTSAGPQWNRFQAANGYPTAGNSLPIPPALALSNSMSENNFPMYHNQQQILASEYPERPGQPECSYFMKTGSCKYKFSCKFHHPRHQLPEITNGAHIGKGLLPLRPDRPICTHYGQYGICKDGPACEYDHPANYSQSAAFLSPMPRPDTWFGNSTVNNRANGSNPGGYFIKPQQSL